MSVRINEKGVRAGWESKYDTERRGGGRKEGWGKAFWTAVQF